MNQKRATHAFIIGSILGSFVAFGAAGCDHEEVAVSNQLSEIHLDEVDINDIAIVHGTEHLGSYQGNQLDGIEVSTFSIQPGRPRSQVHIGEISEEEVRGFITDVIDSRILETGGYDTATGGPSEFLILRIGNLEYSFVAPAGGHELAVAAAIEDLMRLLECGEGSVVCDDTMTCSLGMCIPI